ncbi:MAG: DUF3108 domain-containing protein [Alphaproteobacteria bacterium]
MRIAIFIIAAMLWPVCARAETVRPMTLQYEVYVGGVHLLDGAAHVDIGAKTYRAAAKAETVGVWGEWFPWELAAESEGDAGDDSVTPKHHKLVSAWKHKPQSILLDYHDDGRVTYNDASTDAPEPQERLADDMVRSTFDPLSGVLQLMAHYMAHQDCNARAAVFDGKHRFDLIAKDLGTVNLRASEASAYAGPAHKCELRFDMIAGQGMKQDAGIKKFWQPMRGRGNRPPFTVWLGQIRPDLPPLPVRAESESPFGMVMINLQSWKLDPAPVIPAAVKSVKAKPARIQSAKFKSKTH